MDSGSRPQTQRFWILTATAGQNVIQKAPFCQQSGGGGLAVDRPPFQQPGGGGRVLTKISVFEASAEVPGCKPFNSLGVGACRLTKVLPHIYFRLELFECDRIISEYGHILC